MRPNRTKNTNAKTPVHPGKEIKRELEKRKITQRDLAEKIGVSHTQLNEVLNGKRTLNTEMALLIGAALRIDAEPWLYMQVRYDMAKLKSKSDFISKLDSISNFPIILEW